MQQNLLRLKREMKRFETSSLHGITCWQTENIDQLKASIVGPDGTPYEDGIFDVDIQIPERYPFVPPNVRFITPVYHPNIDDSGRICMDMLKMPPHGSWKPCLNLSSVLIGIQLLLSEPNFGDALMGEIAMEYQKDRETFEKKAHEWTNKHAKKNHNHSKETKNKSEECSSKKHSLDLTDELSAKKLCAERSILN